MKPFDELASAEDCQDTVAFSSRRRPSKLVPMLETKVGPKADGSAASYVATDGRSCWCEADLAKHC